ncbi:HAMP domain-containing sensor histidine kinase [Modestobacter sp. Leaf380]|uniref:sensor histidine kinase n=1 Tax=Modestobacter sp. Leaf380 TaxID=1736356 RepID=UPI000B1B72BA|nr:HAMP domain-containing sensor histidine kinase [Modestobacter sp. Leaf380]
MPRAARTRIIGWVLLLVLLSLATVTLLTWRLLVREADDRMTSSLRAEITEFRALVDNGLDPSTGQPFASVADVLQAVLTYNQARPNEKFLGYVDGGYRFQSRIEAPVLLSQDAAFTALVGSVTETRTGSYASGAGEVLYIAVPVSLAGDPSTGVVVAAFFADEERQPADRTAQLMLLVGGLTSLAAAGGAWVVAGRILRPVRDVAATAQGITETDLSGRIEVPEGPGDELADLAHSVNAMLDRVENGVAAQRRFLDDAGHELRTPITIVRGHLEVLDPADAADVRETVALVDDELDRMNRIVSDLLLLARAEQPAFVRPQPVDVGALTVDVVDKVRKLGDRQWVLETVADADVLLDPQRVTQAVVALADNAVHVTEPGDRIGIGSRLTGDELRIWVADTGPGVAEEDRERVFQRFSRGQAGARRTDGAGLGLSIVTAIAVAHGGRVALDSVPGRGATFTLVLPAQLAPPSPDVATPDGTVDDSSRTADVPEPAGGHP